MRAVGVDVGGTSIKVGVVDDRGELLRSSSYPTGAERGPDHVLATVVNAIQLSLDEEIAAVGLGVPGALNEQGEICYPPNFPGWEVIDVAARLRPMVGRELPIVVENDANVAAYAEAHGGACGAHDESLLYITLGTGVGGCIIHRGEIWHGGGGGAGEVGHVSIDANGVECKCGSIGCVETYLGSGPLVADALTQLADYPDSILHRWLADGTPLTPDLLDRAAREGDRFAASYLTERGTMLGAALASAMNLCDIPVVVIGGGVAAAWETLVVPAAESLRRRLLASVRPRLEVRRARFSNDAGMIGAGLLALHNIH